MTTITDIIHRVFGRKVIGPNDLDFKHLFMIHKAAMDAMESDLTLQTMAGQAASLTMRTINESLDQSPQFTMACLAQNAMTSYKIGMVLGREMEKANVKEKAEAEEPISRLII